jgi:hypothetical protein
MHEGDKGVTITIQGPAEKFVYLLKSNRSRSDPRPDPRSDHSESRIANKPILRGLSSAETIGNNLESRKQESRIDSLSYNSISLQEAIEEAIRKPKLGVYSPVAAAVLRYKAITMPRYSMGGELRIIIERALREAYPQLYEEAQRMMSESQD